MKVSLAKGPLSTGTRGRGVIFTNKQVLRNERMGNGRKFVKQSNTLDMEG